MKFGIEDKHWIELENLLLKPLRAKKVQIYVFGSRARGDFRKFSDLDLLLSFNEQKLLSDAELFKIKEALADSNLPIKVDIALENELAESYRDQILKERILV